MIDLHTHTTASDGRCTPAELVARASAAGVTVLSVTDHDTVAGCDAAAAACRAAGLEFVAGIEITAVLRQPSTCMCSAISSTSRSPALAGVSGGAARAAGSTACARSIDRLAAFGIRLDADAILQPAIDDSEQVGGAPVDCARAGRRRVRGRPRTRRSTSGWRAAGPRSSRALGAAPEEVIATHSRRRRHRVDGASRACIGRDELDCIAWPTPDWTRSRRITPTTTASHGRYLALAQRLGLGVSGGSDYHADQSHGAPHPGSVVAAARGLRALVQRLKPELGIRTRTAQSGQHAGRIQIPDSQSDLRRARSRATIRATASAPSTSS